MDKQAIIGESVKKELNTFLKNKINIDSKASDIDVQLINEDKWLKDAEVIDAVIYRQGSWQVRLVFTLYTHPLQIIVRNIRACFSEQKATTSANFIRKEIEKETTKKLTVSIDLLHLCNN